MKAEIEHVVGEYRHTLLSRHAHGKEVLVVLKNTITEDRQCSTEFVVVKDNEVYATYPLVSFAINDLNRLAGEQS